MQIDTAVYYQITDPKLYTYGIEQPILAIENLRPRRCATLIGDLELDQCLTSRDIVNTKMRQILDEATDPWGIKVNRVELKKYPPAQEEIPERDGKADEGRTRTPAGHSARRGEKRPPPSRPGRKNRRSCAPMRKAEQILGRRAAPRQF